MISFGSSIVLLLLIKYTISIETGECSAEDGNCEALQRCGIKVCSKKSSIYDFGGGSAQAFKPNAPMKLDVCAPQLDTKYNVASWPWSRGSRNSGVPHLSFEVNLWSCKQGNIDQCCCTPFSSESITMEIWQARPDGTYSSISPGREEGDCRATVPVKGSKASFETLAPGSTGSLGGLGPFGWDSIPYGPPVLHMLISAKGHDRSLHHLPLLMDRKNLERRNFRWSEWRGAAYFTQPKTRETGYEITSWTTKHVNSVKVEMDVFLSQTEQSDAAVKDAFCTSRFYGLPSSFFLEPIALCAPSMLDFFEL